MSWWISWPTATKEATETERILTLVKDWVPKACSCSFLEKPFDIHSDTE
jgi:hypothetical protein